MERFMLFGIISLPLILVSWRTLFHFQSHGFYRFLSWECILWLFISNYAFWFDDPFTFKQIISWIFLLCSGYLVVVGAMLIKRMGRSGENRINKKLYRFERTTELIDNGIFKYIRHPLYSSLLFLTWGIYLKHTSQILALVAFFSTVTLYLTAIFDEKECIRFFGEKYKEYMKRSKRFIPFIL